MNRSPLRFSLAVVIVAVTAAVSVPWAATESDCTATLDARISSEEDTMVQFEVEVASQAGCAHIVYDLVIEEQMPNDQTHRVRKIREVKLDDGSLTEIVQYSLAPGYTILDFEAETVSCRRCTLDE